MGVNVVLHDGQLRTPVTALRTRGAVAVLGSVPLVDGNRIAIALPVLGGEIVAVPPLELPKPSVPVVVPGLPITGLIVADQSDVPRFSTVPLADGAPKAESNSGLSWVKD